MPTQYISNYIVTGIEHETQYSSSLETPLSASETLIVERDIFFGIGSEKYNSLRQSLGLPTITNFSTQTLTLFLCDSINNITEQFVNVHELKSYALSGVTNGYVLQNISNIVENYGTNDLLLENMNETEIQKLKKSFVLVSRINPTASPNTTASIQTGDIIQTFNLMVDLNQPGPYEVEFENIDIISPNDFTDNERLQFYQKNIATIAMENVRCFYPKNIQELSARPLVIFARANAGILEAHDTYFNLFASYGYFCIGIPLEVSSTNLLIFDRGPENTTAYNPWYFSGNESLTFYGTTDSAIQWGTQVLGIIDHIEKNTSKILNGKFLNKIDFTKIVSAGHSRGGGAAISFYDLLQYKNEPNSLISHFNTNLQASNVKAIIGFAPQKGDSLQNDGSIANICGPITTDADQSSIVPPSESIPYTQRFYTYQRGISLPQFSLLGSTQAAKLKLNINIPSLYIYPEFDDDTAEITPFLYRATNINDQLNILSKKKMIIMKKASHNSISNPPIPIPTLSSLFSLKYNNFSSDYGVILNTLTSRIRFLAGKCLEFISESVYNHNLNNFITNVSDLNTRDRSISECFLYTEQPLFSKINLTIDDFSSEIFTTNFTGYTFGLPIPKFLSDGLRDISAPGFTMGPELCAKGLLYLADRMERRETFGGYSFGSAPFNRIGTANGRGFLTSFNSSSSSYFINYDYTGSEIDLSGASFIHVDMCQVPGSTFNDENNIALQFAVSLADSSNNGATLSGFNYNYGVSDPGKFFDSGTAGITYWAVSTLAPIKFRLQDFEMKNKNLNLNSIKSINLLFGSNYGTTQGTIYLDSIYALNGS
jgi:hypothetical protein